MAGLLLLIAGVVAIFIMMLFAASKGFSVAITVAVFGCVCMVLSIYLAAPHWERD